MTDEIKHVIEQAVPQATVFVKDPNNDGQHLEAIVISPLFEGMMIVKQHQMIMGALKNHFAGSLHALSLKTFTPDKWLEAKHQFNL